MTDEFLYETDEPPRRTGLKVLVVLVLCFVVAGGFAAWKLRGPSPQELLDQAQALYEQGQAAQAATLMAQAITAFPDDPEVSRLFVDILLTAGNGLGLERELKRSRKQGIERPDTEVLLLRALFLQGQYREVLGQAVQLPNTPDILKIKGDSQLRLGMLDGASRTYTKVLIANAADVKARRGLAKIAIRRNALREAESHLEVLQIDHSDDVETLMLLGSLKHHLMDYAGAQTAYSKVLEINPAHRDARIGLARINLSTGNPQKSREWLAPLSPNATINLIRGMAAQELGEFAQARILYQQSLRWSPKNYDVLLHLGYTHRALGEPTQAIQRLQAAHKIKPGEPSPLLTVADIQQEAGDTKAVVDTIGELIVLHPGWLDGSEPIPERTDLLQLVKFVSEQQPNRFDFQLFSGRWARQAHNLDEALTIAASLQNHPQGKALGYQLEGDVWLDSGDADKGIESYKRALETGPVHKRLASLLIGSDRPSEAIAVLRDQIQNQPADLEARVLLAIAAQKLGDDTLAMDEFRKVLDLQPTHSHALAQLAAYFHREKDQASAIEYIERAQRAAPTDAQILSTFGLLLVSIDPPRALSALNLAIELRPLEPRFRLALARALAAVGNHDQSREQVEFLLKLPDAKTVSSDAQVLLERLDSHAQQ